MSIGVGASPSVIVNLYRTLSIEAAFWPPELVQEFDMAVDSRANFVASSGYASLLSPTPSPSLSTVSVASSGNAS